jgi:hypothetical protein
MSRNLRSLSQPKSASVTAPHQLQQQVQSVCEQLQQYVSEHKDDESDFRPSFLQFAASLISRDMLASASLQQLRSLANALELHNLVCNYTAKFSLRNTVRCFISGLLGYFSPEHRDYFTSRAYSGKRFRFDLATYYSLKDPITTQVDDKGKDIPDAESDQEDDEVEQEQDGDDEDDGKVEDVGGVVRLSNREQDDSGPVARGQPLSLSSPRVPRPPFSSPSTNLLARLRASASANLATPPAPAIPSTSAPVLRASVPEHLFVPPAPTHVTAPVSAISMNPGGAGFTIPTSAISMNSGGPAVNLPSSARRLAEEAFMSASGSFSRWMSSVQFHTERNKNECVCLASVLDTAVKAGVSLQQDFMEMLVRRMLGVHIADQTGNWKACSALSLAGYGNTLVPPDVLKSIASEIHQLDKLQTDSSAKSRYGSRKPTYQKPRYNDTDDEERDQDRFSHPGRSRRSDNYRRRGYRDYEQDYGTREKKQARTASRPTPPGGHKQQAASGADRESVSANQQ